MNEQFNRILEEAKIQISHTPSPLELDKLRVHYLGKKGLITTLLHQLKDLTGDKRKTEGSQLNVLKDEIEGEIDSRIKSLQKIEVDKELARTSPLDITLPGLSLASRGSVHPISQVSKDLYEILSGLGFSWTDGPEVEHEYFNFEALNTPEHHPARDLQDTFYIAPSILLRSHTSPVQIRTMKKKTPPVQVMTIGKVYRADYDQTHTPMFHQMEGLMIAPNISLSDLKGIITYVVTQLFGNRPLRFRPSYFPFTEPSAEIDILWSKGQWLEIAGSGMVHPNVLRAVGYDPDEVSGFAFGMGIERVAMLKYGISDLRSFFENDLRFLEQF